MVTLSLGDSQIQFTLHGRVALDWTSMITNWNITKYHTLSSVTHYTIGLDRHL